MFKRRSLVAVVAVLALGAAACSSDDSSDSTTAPEATDAPETTDGDTTDTEAPSTTDGDTTDTTVVEVQEATSRLDAVKAAGTVACGTRDELPGFAFVDASGDHVGFDADFCRVIAAAVLGDATAVDFVDLETADRFTALQSGRVDILIRNTTWTATRDGGEGSTFLQPNFYDGQGMMVAADSGYASVDDMANEIVCVAKGTTTEGNAAAESARLGLDWEVRAFDDTDQIQEAFLAGQCGGWSSDVSQLTALRSSYPDGANVLSILPEVFSKEPLAPAVADGDTGWFQATNWAILATIQAEEFGITQANVDEIRDTTEDLNIQRFLGVTITNADGTTTVTEPGLGLPTDFAYQIVSQVGNYGEIFERHLTPLGLERGLNSLWIDGGLLYSPPYR